MKVNHQYLFTLTKSNIFSETMRHSTCVTYYNSWSIENNDKPDINHINISKLHQIMCTAKNLLALINCNILWQDFLSISIQEIQLKFYGRVHLCDFPLKSWSRREVFHKTDESKSRSLQGIDILYLYPSNSLSTWSVNLDSQLRVQQKSNLFLDKIYA